MTLLVYVALLLGAAVFALASAARAVMFAKMPLHLRWELYPIPHEGKRARYGGSYFEVSEWWKHPRHVGHLATIRAMATEILALKALREFNRPLWWRSYPFHLGLYLLAASCGLVLLTALGDLAAPGVLRGWPQSALGLASMAAGAAGVLLTLVGAAGLLLWRLTDSAAVPYTTAGDIGNLVAFLAAVGLTSVGWAVRPAGAPGPVAIVEGVLRWDLGVGVPTVFGLGLVASATLAAYIPFTHMSHFVAKYFTYHSVRWDDAPVKAAGALEERLAAHLALRPTWSAPHVGADGQRSWGEIASTKPFEGARK